MNKWGIELNMYYVSVQYVNCVEWLNFGHLTHDCIYFEFFILIFFLSKHYEWTWTWYFGTYWVCVVAGLVCVICDIDNPCEECAASKYYQKLFFFLINIIFEFKFSESRHHAASARIRRRSVAQTIYSFAFHSPFLNSILFFFHRTAKIAWNDNVKTLSGQKMTTTTTTMSSSRLKLMTLKWHLTYQSIIIIVKFRPSNFIFVFALTTF